MITPEYVRIVDEQSDLIMGLRALCQCNKIEGLGRIGRWAWDESLPWPHLRARIRELEELRKAAR